MNIKINPNSDCAEEIIELKELLRKSKHYTAESFSYAAIVSIAVDELYDKLRAELK